ncbi:hypothetical protein AB0B63_07090 [Micromonospora sp. NPDC049081]|uniref:hypothetical protein n=1 Tax=Micromonospora sp. NPDC049081 TaxID=3155150 RepID=UPI0033C2C36A
MTNHANLARTPDPGQSGQWHMPTPAGDGWITLTTPPPPISVDNTTTGDTQPAQQVGSGNTMDELRTKLAVAREHTAVKRHHEQIRHVQDVRHRVAMADATEWSTAVERARRERTRDAAESAELAQLHRWAARSGERARIRADIQRSAEMRALRVAKVRRYTMLAGLPVMVGFALISTPGVHAGMVNMLNLTAGSVGWATAWFVEPLLIAVATSIIVVKSTLKMSGGSTDWRADVTKWGALLFSVALNMLGGWTGSGDILTAVGEALSHSVGAIGAAVTAWLIGVIVDYASKANPWKDAPRLTDLGLLPTVTVSPVTGEPVTPPGDAPVAGGSDARQAVTLTQRPSPSPRPAVTTPTAVTPAKRPAVTAPPVTQPRVTTPTADAPPASDVTEDNTPPSPARTATDTTAPGKVRPLSRDLIDARFRDWTVDQIEEYAAERARAVAADTGNKTAGMREYFLVCLALGVDPKGSLMARVVGIKGEGLGRAKAKQWHGELTVADAEQVLRDAMARVASELTAEGDTRA